MIEIICCANNKCNKQIKITINSKKKKDVECKGNKKKKNLKHLEIFGSTYSRQFFSCTIQLLYQIFGYIQIIAFFNPSKKKKKKKKKQKTKNTHTDRHKLFSVYLLQKQFYTTENT